MFELMFGKVTILDQFKSDHTTAGEDRRLRSKY
jgi:hypothetical protein